MTRQMTRRTALGVLGTSALGVALAACGGGSGSGSGAGGSSGLALANYDTTQQAVLTKKALAAFQKASGISVSVDSLPGSGAAIYPGKLRTEMLGGKAPDVFRCWGGSIAAPFVTAKQVISLDSAYRRYGWGSKLATGNVKDMTFNGTRYGLPLWASAVGVWYSAKDYEKAGVAVPTTFAEMENVNAALAKAGIQPWLAGGKYGWYVMRFFEWFLEMTAGPVEHDKLRNTETSWNTASVVDAFAILQKWAAKKWLPSGVMALDPTQVEANFTGGQGAMALDGQWIEQNIVTAKMAPSSYGTFIPPTDQTPLRFSGFTEGLFISTESASSGNAEKLLNFFTSVSSSRPSRTPTPTSWRSRRSPATRGRRSGPSGSPSTTTTSSRTSRCRPAWPTRTSTSRATSCRAPRLPRPPRPRCSRQSCPPRASRDA
jgi:raffinose/stachyose/melibiose transport system substrate-binding protein